MKLERTLKPTGSWFELILCTSARPKSSKYYYTLFLLSAGLDVIYLTGNSWEGLLRPKGYSAGSVRSILIR